MNHIRGNTSRFGSAIQVLPSDIRTCSSSFLISAVAVVFISMFISVIEFFFFFINVNSYVGNKVDLYALNIFCGILPISDGNFRYLFHSSISNN